MKAGGSKGFRVGILCIMSYIELYKHNGKENGNYYSVLG